MDVGGRPLGANIEQIGRLLRNRRQTKPFSRYREQRRTRSGDPGSAGDAIVAGVVHSAIELLPRRRAHVEPRAIKHTVDVGRTRFTLRVFTAGFGGASAGGCAGASVASTSISGSSFVAFFGVVGFALIFSSRTMKASIPWRMAGVRSTGTRRGFLMLGMTSFVPGYRRPRGRRFWLVSWPSSGWRANS